MHPLLISFICIWAAAAGTHFLIVQDGIWSAMKDAAVLLSILFCFVYGVVTLFNYTLPG